MSIPELIKAARKEAKMTQVELAKELKVPPYCVSRWEGGSRIPSSEVLLSIAKALKKDLVFADKDAKI